MAKADCPGSNPHLGSPQLVTWGSEEVGDNESIKVPFVSKDIEYIKGYLAGDDGASDRWMEKEVWTLTGEIINCKGYEEILKTQETLVKKFEADYKTLKVGDLEALQFARVRSIEFGDSNYLDNTPYSIVIEGYRSAADLAADRRVTNPVASYTWSENDDGTMELSYDVSARGIVTDDSNNALDNAKKFVKDYLSAKNHMFNDTESPDFLPTIAYHGINTAGKRFLVKDEENINRGDGSYGVTRVYKIDQTEETSSILRYTVNSEQDFGEDKIVTFDGTIELGYKGIGTPKENIAELRNRYYEFKRGDQIKDPDTDDKLKIENVLSEKINEDELAGLLTFTLVFSERDKGCVDDYSVNVQESAESSLLTVRIDGQMKKLGPCGWDEVLYCFYGAYDTPCRAKTRTVAARYIDIAKFWYWKFRGENPDVGDGIPTTIGLNKSPIELSITENENDRVINYSIVFNDRISFDAHKVEYTMNINLPVREIAVNSLQQICGGGGHGFGDPNCSTASDPAKSHHYQDLGIAQRGTFGIKITVKGHANFVEGGPFEFAEGLKEEFTDTQDGLSSEDSFLTKNISGGSEKTIKDDTYRTYEYEWSWTQIGSSNVVNSSSTNRALIKKLYFGK